MQQCPTPVFECRNLFEKIKTYKKPAVFSPNDSFSLDTWIAVVSPFSPPFFFTVGPCRGVASALYGSLQYPGAKPSTTQGRFPDPKNIPTFPSSLDEIQGSFLDPWDKIGDPHVFFTSKCAEKSCDFKADRAHPNHNDHLAIALLKMSP